MRNSRSLIWRQVIAGSLIALGLALALANIGETRMAKAGETPPTHSSANHIVNQTWRAPKITAVGG